MATLVTKIGSSNLVQSTGELDLLALATIVHAIAELKEAGHPMSAKKLTPSAPPAQPPPAH